jgi:alkylhydroperoxidase/carboxymuconolactone decarboxylase family protein YurZ
MPADGTATEPEDDAAEQVPLPRRSAHDTEGEVARVLAKLDAAGARMRLLRVLANSATGFRPFVLLTTGLLSSHHLPRRIQEIVILILAASQGVQYEWEEHVTMALAAGVPEDLVARIERHRGAIDDAGFSAEELLAVGFADDVLGGRTLTGDRWAAAVQAWGAEGALDLLMTVAVWGALVPTLITGLGLRHAD